MTVRQAHLEDRFALVRLSRDLHNATSAPFLFNAAHVEATFKACIADDDKLCLVLDECGVCGFFAAQAIDSPLWPVRVAVKLMWWVDPAHRTGAARPFLEAYEGWARDNGCSAIDMAAHESEPRTGLLFKRQGYVPAETHYLKVL